MMQVQAYSRTGNPSRQAAAVRRSTGGFSVLLADTARKASSGVGVAQLSPAMQMESRYLEWRKTRTPIDLPGSEGWTEENIQYLKDRYPGELSLFERKEALTVMRNMRCITQEEYLRALGEDGQMVVEDAGKATCRSGPLDELPTLPDSDWLLRMLAAPLGKARTLDMLLELLSEM